MGHKGLDIFLRFSGIIMVLSIVCIAITSKGSAERIVSILSLALSIAVFTTCSILINKKEKL